MNVVHNVRIGSTVTGTVKASWMRLTFEDDDIDFKAFTKIHTNFPRLFEPAFRLQQQMMVKTLGEFWWTMKKRALQNDKDEAALKVKKLAEKKEKRKQQKKNRKTQRNMGMLRYYLCPCLRKYYDPSLSEMDKLTAEQKQEREQQLKLQRRQRELEIKNPETAEWKQYQKKVEHELAVIEEHRVLEIKGKTEMKINESKEQSKKDSRRNSVPKASPRNGRKLSNSSKDTIESSQVTDAAQSSYLESKLAATSRPREERAVSRAARRDNRKRDLKDL